MRLQTCSRVFIYTRLNTAWPTWVALFQVQPHHFSWRLARSSPGQHPSTLCGRRHWPHSSKVDDVSEHTRLPHAQPAPAWWGSVSNGGGEERALASSTARTVDAMGTLSTDAQTVSQAAVLARAWRVPGAGAIGGAGAFRGAGETAVGSDTPSQWLYPSQPASL